MLHILLLILKIIGIILAILTGCLLLGLCLVLFLPVHYRIELNRTEGEGSPPVEAKAKITWLLHFMNIRLQYPADIYLRVRILFFTLFRLPQKHKEGKKEKAPSRQAGQPTEGVQTEQNTDNTHKGQDTEGAEDKSGETELPGGVDTADEEVHDTENKLSLKSKLNKICNQFKNIWSKIKNIRYTIKRICDKIKEIVKSIEYYSDIIKSDTFKRAFSLCKDELGDIFKYVKPRKFNADLIIGMDDPAATGQILSYYGMLYPIIGNNVTVSGDFDRKRIEGSVFIKGKIRLFTFLKAVIRIYFSKDIRKLLKLFKKEDA